MLFLSFPSLLFLQNKRSPYARCADEMFVVYISSSLFLCSLERQSAQTNWNSTQSVCTNWYSIVWYSLACRCCYYFCVWKKNILFMVNIAWHDMYVVCFVFFSTTKKPYEFTCAKDFSHRPAIWVFFHRLITAAVYYVHKHTYVYALSFRGKAQIEFMPLWVRTARWVMYLLCLWLWINWDFRFLYSAYAVDLNYGCDLLFGKFTFCECDTR